MSKRIVLMRNMGNSGGAWLMKICTMHKKVLMLAEINEVLRLKYVPKPMYPDVGIDYDVKISQKNENRHGTMFESRTQCELGFRFLLNQYKIRKEEVIGLIKGFDAESIKKCKDICDSVKVIQTFRNPVGIIDFYMSLNDAIPGRRQIAFDEPYEECFKKHIEFFCARFKNFLQKIPTEKIIKLEDINRSLKDNTPFFKETMEEIFEVEWTNDFITEIIKKEGYGDDGSESRGIWKGWESWKKEHFMKSFKIIMEDLNYMFIVS